MNRNYLQSPAEFEAWYIARMDGEQRVYVYPPLYYPCVVVWKWCGKVFEFDFVYLSDFKT